MEPSVLTLTGRIASRIDRTVKYTFSATRATGEVVHLEVAHIDKQDGKHILCMPTQSSCAMACTFCHTTLMAGKVAVSDLTEQELVEAVTQTFQQVSHWAALELDLPDPFDKMPWLISFMGCGEPLKNWRSVVRAMNTLRKQGELNECPTRFAIATMLPSRCIPDLVSMGSYIQALSLPVKLHLSLHFTTDEQRKSYMPAAHTIAGSLDLLQWYREHTGNPVEIHYTLIEGENASIQDVWNLRTLLKDTDLPIKFLHFAPKPGEKEKSPTKEWREFLLGYMTYAGIASEYYAPPGSDIDAACGQFTAQDYIETSQLVQIGISGETV